MPRSWIPEFNRTHILPRAEGEKARPTARASADRDRRDLYAAKRRFRQGIRREQIRRFNRDLRTLQQGLAALIAVLGLLLAGALGLGIGLLLGLVVLSFRLRL